GLVSAPDDFALRIAPPRALQAMNYRASPSRNEICSDPCQAKRTNVQLYLKSTQLAKDSFARMCPAPRRPRKSAVVTVRSAQRPLSLPACPPLFVPPSATVI